MSSMQATSLQPVQKEQALVVINAHKLVIMALSLHAIKEMRSYLINRMRILLLMALLLMFQTFQTESSKRRI